MSIFNGLYDLLIGPLELLFEVIFALANRVAGTPAMAIVILSLAVNFLVLPLYKRADAMQEESRLTEARLHPWVSHIKKTFRGDERFMILQTYYRQNHYKPTDALKGSMSLLLEIPFFMAAYNFLSELQLLQGVSFGPVRDLGAPDGLLVIGGVCVNVLPVLMTLINVISGAIYTKGFPLKSKLQLYGMALIFLILLYDSPSGLVFYWTLNNLFSLAKNIFYKLKDPRRVLALLASAAGLAGLAAAGLLPGVSVRRRMLLAAAMAALQLPLLWYFLSRRIRRSQPAPLGKNDKLLFWSGCVFLTLLTGLLIPSAVIRTSPEEFINALTLTNPLMYVLRSLLLAAGTFCVWFGIFYMLASPSGKRMMGLGMWIASAAAVITYMFFGKNYGTLSPSLQYDRYPDFFLRDQLVNLAVLALAAAVCRLLWKKKAELVKAVYLAAIAAAVVMSAVNTVGIQSVVPAGIEKLQSAVQKPVELKLSKTGKNVVVIMMDRAVNGYIPYLFQEKPELKEQFAGFTYYPNTISYGAHTNFGAPAFYGGYEYTPEEMNARWEEKLVDKHNEALKVMPVLFDRSDYRVTVCDPPYANYQWTPDLSIYDEYPDIQAYNTLGMFPVETRQEQLQAQELLGRNLFCYGVFKSSPVILQPTLYSQGLYNQPDGIANQGKAEQVITGTTQARGTKKRFLQAYEVLKRLPEVTAADDTQENTFLMLSNDATHEPMLLQEPEYVPSAVVDNTAYDAAHTDRFVLDGRKLEMTQVKQVCGYHINMASMLQLGQWLDHLRQLGVYDNTRIIIGSDHGYYMEQLADMRFGDWDLMAYNPLLLVKDFGSTEFTVDDRFMTNADVPYLAAEGIVEELVNPMTGKPLDPSVKERPQHISLSTEYNIAINNGTTFLPGAWLEVRGSLLDHSGLYVLEMEK